jgi:hypothetical protein
MEYALMGNKIWRYLELEKIQHLPNRGRELLGRYLYFTEKRDGSCLAVYLKLKSRFKRILIKLNLKRTVGALKWHTLSVSSRNMESAEKSICNDFYTCGEAGAVLSYLKDNPTHIVFGEILRKGISPTRIEDHEKVEFIVFDIYDGTCFLGYQQVHQFCFHYGMKCVRLFGEGRFTSTESLYEYRDQMLEICKQEKREGVVLKTFNDEGKPLYAKEKLDTATPRGQPKLEKGRPQYPPLPLSEAMGAVDKVYADLGQAFGEKAKAMPLVARYIQEEMKKHLCGQPEYDFYRLYCDYCKDHNITTITDVTKVTNVTTMVTKVSIWKKIFTKVKNIGKKIHRL